MQRLNADTNAIDRFVGVRGSPSGVAADGEVIWVVSELDDEATLTKIDNATGERLGEISLGTMLPRSVAAGEGSVWVGGHGFGEVFGQKPGLSGGVLVRVDRDTEAATAIPLGAVPQDVAAGEGFAWAVGSVPFNNDVFLVERIDPLNNTVAQVEVQLNTENPEKAGTLAAGEGFIWLTGHTDSLKRIDPRTLAVENVELDLDSSGREPTRVAVGHGSVWVTTDPGRPDTAGAPPATLSRLDPVTGDVLAMIVVGPVADIVTVGEDAVWVEACPQKEGPLGRTGCSQETTAG